MDIQVEISIIKQNVYEPEMASIIGKSHPNFILSSCIQPLANGSPSKSPIPRILPIYEKQERCSFDDELG